MLRGNAFDVRQGRLPMPRTLLKHLIFPLAGLASLVFAACSDPGAKPFESGNMAAGGGTLGVSGNNPPTTGGVSPIGSGGASGGMSGSAGSGGSEAPLKSGRPGFGNVAGGVLMKSPSFQAWVASGESPGHNNSSASPNFRMIGGVIGTTQNK